MDNAKVEVSLTITKASLQPDGTMRWQAVASDTSTDRTGEQTSLALFKDWIERAESGKSADWLPEPRRPFLGLSHYPDLGGFGEAGPTERMYIDGSMFKAAGTFYADADHPLGKALFEAVRGEQELVRRGETIEQPIRISAAWWDIAHQHGAFTFERKGMTDVCPMCAQGVEGKVYLKGQLDHFAATRVPINPRTSLALEEKAMTKRIEDAASIVDEGLATELEQRARLIGKAETEEAAGLVVKGDGPEMMEEEYQPFGGAVTMAEAMRWMEGQETMAKAQSRWGIFQALMSNIMRDDQPDQMRTKMQALIGEFGNEIARLKAAVEDAYLLDDDETEEEPVSTFDEAVEALGEAVTTDAPREAKIEAVNRAFAQLGEVVKAQIDAVTPPTAEEQVVKAFAPVVEKLDLLLAKIGQPAAPAAAPQQKSLVYSGQVNPQPAGQTPVSPVTGQPSSLTAMIRRSVGIQ